MPLSISYKTKTASAKDILDHIYQCDDDFIISLINRLNIEEYVQKLINKAITFEAWYKNELIGLVATYYNDDVDFKGYITSVSTIKSYTGKGIANILLKNCIEYAKSNNFIEIHLEVEKDNLKAISLYNKYGFSIIEESQTYKMRLLLKEKDYRNPLVSIICVTYNHENYISQALDSFLMQKTTFPFEIILGEDCSTDKTREICIAYWKKHPDKIKLILHSKNVGAAKNHFSAMEASRAKYLANCEGDDFWTDPYKLQKQIDYLEKHPNTIISFHNFSMVNTGGEIITEQGYPNNCKKILDIDDIIKGEYAKMLTIVFRREVLFNNDLKVFDGLSDTCIEAILLCKGGNAVMLEDNMGAYRVHEGGISSMKSEKDLLKQGLKSRKNILSVAYKRKISYRLNLQISYAHLRSAELLFKEGDVSTAKNQWAVGIKQLFRFRSYNFMGALLYGYFYINYLRYLFYGVRLFIKISFN